MGVDDFLKTSFSKSSDWFYRLLMGFLMKTKQKQKKPKCNPLKVNMWELRQVWFAFGVSKCCLAPLKY